MSHEGNHLRQGFQKDRCATLDNVILINSPFLVPGKSSFLDGNAAFHVTSRISEIS